MPRNGARWHAGQSIEGAALPWTPKEIADLARAFIDLDLDGPRLYAWCAAHGINRSPGAIDARLAKLNFFDTEAAENEIKARPKPAKTYTGIPDKKLADFNLANQIKLARLEAEAGAPLYKPKEIA
jgi:hypothetical protein